MEYDVESMKLYVAVDRILRFARRLFQVLAEEVFVALRA
jgi:hypothetical protein